MRDDRPGLFDSGGHQKRRPVNRMKAENVFANQVQRRPELFKAHRVLLLLIAKTNRRYVIRQRVEPDIHCVLRIVGHGHAPTHRTFQTANRKILQAATNETSDFIASRLGPHKIRS